MLKTVICLMFVGYTTAIVCTPQLCESIQQNAKPLECKGAVVKGGGFCGCGDACAKVSIEHLIFVNYVFHYKVHLLVKTKSKRVFGLKYAYDQ